MKMAAQDGKGLKVTYTLFQKVTSKWLESNLYISLSYLFKFFIYFSVHFHLVYDQSYLVQLKQFRNMTIGGLNMT